jgi:hypothetical protein
MSLCDHLSVGVIIEGARGYAGEPDTFLLLHRLTPPVGIAPVAGHVDGHGGIFSTAFAEVEEESGLRLDKSLKNVVREFWRSNACQRDYSGEVGHSWTVLQGKARGFLKPEPGKTKDLRWYTRDELQTFAVRTAMRAVNDTWGEYGVTAEEFAARPGIEPVWVEWLWRANLINMSASDREAINMLAGRASVA